MRDGQRPIEMAGRRMNASRVPLGSLGRFLLVVWVGLHGLSVDLPASEPTSVPYFEIGQGKDLARYMVQNPWFQDGLLNAKLRIQTHSNKKQEVPVTLLFQSRQGNWSLSCSFPDHERRHRLFLNRDAMGTTAFQSSATAEALPVPLSEGEWFQGVAGSGFSPFELSLGFLDWNSQKIETTELRRGQSCYVLLSQPGETDRKGGWRSVRSWIDKDTLGVVYAEVHGDGGKRLKIFKPNEFKKINGTWQVTELEMRDLLSKERSYLTFEDAESIQ